MHFKWVLQINSSQMQTCQYLKAAFFHVWGIWFHHCRCRKHSSWNPPNSFLLYLWTNTKQHKPVWRGEAVVRLNWTACELPVWTEALYQCGGVLQSAFEFAWLAMSNQWRLHLHKIFLLLMHLFKHKPTSSAFGSFATRTVRNTKTEAVDNWPCWKRKEAEQRVSAEFNCNPVLEGRGFSTGKVSKQVSELEVSLMQSGICFLLNF